MKKFGKHVDDLFAHGAAVNFASLAAANKLDSALEAERAKRYGMDRLAVEYHMRPRPMDLTPTQQPYSYRFERERLEQLKKKFGVEGLQIEGMAKVNSPKPKRFEALGTYRGQRARLVLDVTF